MTPNPPPPRGQGNEFQNLLNDLNLYSVTKLTRTEWSYIRSKMGKPRRLSQAYLSQELQKLRRYREEVPATSPEPYV